MTTALAVATGITTLDDLIRLAVSNGITVVLGSTYSEPTIYSKTGETLIQGATTYSAVFTIPRGETWIPFQSITVIATIRDDGHHTYSYVSTMDEHGEIQYRTKAAELVADVDTLIANARRTDWEL